MIRILFIFYLLFSVLISGAQTKVWNGNGDGSSWNDALNWNPTGVPGLTDNVLLDNSLIQVTYTVILPGGNSFVSINSLTIKPAGSNHIVLKLPVTNISGTAFKANGTGDAIVLNKGAVFINSSGAASGTPVSVTRNGFFRINNDGRYIHNTPRGHTTNLASRLSTVKGTENGIFEFDVPANNYTVSLSGRTYGHLVLSSIANGGIINYTGNGTNTMTVNGDFQINSGVTFNIGLTKDFIVNGNYFQSGSSAFNIQNSNTNNVIKLKGNISLQGNIIKTGTGLPVIELNGSLNQDVSLTGNIANGISFRMNNAAGATLLSPLTLPYNLDLQNGKIKTDRINILTLTDNATVTGGSPASFIEGPMKKTGDDNNFLFPVGKGSIYAPVSFYSPGMSVTDAYEAEYFRSSPQAVYGVNYESALIHHISYTEYWRLEKTSGSIIPVSVTLAATQYSFAEDINSLYVARYNLADQQWKNDVVASRLMGVSFPPYITGSITSMPIIQSGIFTLASSAPEAINPLPVNLISFNVVRINDGKAKITWQLAADNYNSVKFEIERSADGNNFTTIKTIPVNSTERFYTLYDDQTNAESIWYRLKIINADGSSTCSNIVSVRGNLKDWSVSIFPNPVSDKAFININSSTRANLSLLIYDASGKQIRQWNDKVITGNNHIPLQAEDMKSGIYFLFINDGKTKSIIKFVKI